MRPSACLLVSMMMLAVSCTKGTASSVSKAAPVTAGAGQESSVRKDAPAKEPAQSPEIAKLGRVLSSLSDRAKEAIPNGNPQEFLADLQEVLAAEKLAPADDLSLYYLIDKKHFVGADYVPKNLVKLTTNSHFTVNRNDLSLRPDVYEALIALADGARKDGITLLVSSTYRSYAYQEKVFEKWVRIDGLEEAERESARAGTSQHQLGTAVDFGSITDDFIDTRMGQWLNAHADEYGWSLSFPKGYEDVTGFRWECWHFRYIGTAACRFQKKWFSDVQQFMIEFIDAWKTME